MHPSFSAKRSLRESGADVTPDSACSVRGKNSGCYLFMFLIQQHICAALLTPKKNPASILLIRLCIRASAPTRLLKFRRRQPLSWNLSSASAWPLPPSSSSSSCTAPVAVESCKLGLVLPISALDYFIHNKATYALIQSASPHGNGKLTEEVFDTFGPTGFISMNFKQYQKFVARFIPTASTWSCDGGMDIFLDDLICMDKSNRTIDLILNKTMLVTWLIEYSIHVSMYVVQLLTEFARSSCFPKGRRWPLEFDLEPCNTVPESTTRASRLRWNTAFTTSV